MKQLRVGPFSQGDAFGKGKEGGYSAQPLNTIQFL
jgi:hypothetical protein